MADGDDETYRVGFGKPPKHTQFKKGQSGNAGRRWKQPVESRASIIDKVLSERKSVNSNGKTVKMSAFEILVRRTYQRAYETGSIRDLAKLMDLLKDSGVSVHEEYRAKMADANDFLTARISQFIDREYPEYPELTDRDVYLSAKDREEAAIIGGCPNCRQALETQWRQDDAERPAKAWKTRLRVAIQSLLRLPPRHSE